MAKVVVNESTLQDIADAIREKADVTDTFLPSAMVAAIRALPSGVALDVVTAASLPSAVVDNQIVVIASVAPSTVFIDTDEPLNRAVGDLWIQIAADSSVALKLTDEPSLLRFGLSSALVWDGEAWVSYEAHIGVQGAWVKFSSKLPLLGTALSDMSWEDIALVSEAGKSADYFSIGDQKAVSIGGVDYAVEIVGFNHDNLANGKGKAGITFGMVTCFKSTYNMNSSATNVGGWASCARRSSLQGTTFTKLPSDLQAAIKPVTKLTTTGNKSATVEGTTDTLFMFSVWELLGAKSYSAAQEGEQYARFATAADRIKTVNGTANTWFTRSPYGSDNARFCIITAAGNCDYDSAANSRGIAFGFCV